MNKLERIKEIEEQLAALKKEVESEQKEKAWPQIGDKYFVVMSNGDTTRHTWNSDSFDEAAWAIDNCYRTKEAAEAEVSAMKVFAELSRCEGVRKFVLSGMNHYFYFDPTRDSLMKEYTCCVATGQQVWFSSEEQLQAAITKVGEARIIAALKWRSMGVVG